MPQGKVLWYDVDKGFGFVPNPEGDDCFVSKDVLPQGVQKLEKGQRVEFDYVARGRGPQALRIKVLDTPRLRRPAQHKYSAEELNSMISDLATLLEIKVQPSLRAGRYPDRKEGRQVANILRAVAKELDM